MSEERLQEIKDSVNFQREILLAHNMQALCVDEEQELIEEIERLHSIIKEVINYIKEESWFCYKDNEEVIDRTSVEKLLEILDKENK